MSAQPEDTEEIPPPPPANVKVDSPASQIVLFDLETTGRCAQECVMTRIAAMRMDTGEAFNQYVVPMKNITPDATKVTGLSIAMVNGKRVLAKKGEIVRDALSEEESLLRFLEWLPERSVVCAHNCTQFDSKVFVRALRDAEQLSTTKVAGFVDSIAILKATLPKQKGRSFALGNLYKAIIGCEIQNAHDASTDIAALFAVLKAEKVTVSAFMEHSVTLECAARNQLSSKDKSGREQGLKDHLCSGDSPVITPGKHGWEDCCQRFVVRSSPAGVQAKSPKGISLLLKEKTAEGKARVTTRQTIIDAVQDHFLQKAGQ